MALVILAPSRLLSISDGDTPEIKAGIRMLGIDTPELHFPEGRDPSTQDAALLSLPRSRAWKDLAEALRRHLLPRLEKAGTRQARWGRRAKETFEKLVREALVDPRTGRKRQLFLACGKEVFDRYGRLLAYVGPYVPRSEREGQPPPDTFNLRLLASGMAAPNLHRGNVPKPEDLKLAIGAVKAARRRKIGFWKERDRMLHGYEFRSLVRMARGEAGFTYKVRDLRTLDDRRARALNPYDYVSIPDEYRVFE